MERDQATRASDDHRAEDERSAEAASSAETAEPGERATPAEPSHEAVGLGVVEDGTDHHGHDGERETLTAGEAQRTPGALGTEQVQRLPAMAQNNASALEKVTGIVAQTRADVATQPYERIVEVLRERLVQAGVELPDSDIEELARQISTGDADRP